MFQEFLASPSCSQKNFFCQNIVLTLPKWVILIFLQISQVRETPLIKNPTNLGGNQKPHQSLFSSKLRAEQSNLSRKREECRVWLLKVLQLLFSAFFFQHTCFLLGDCKWTIIIIIMQWFSLLGTNSSVAVAVVSLLTLDAADPWVRTELRRKMMLLWSGLNPTKRCHDHLRLVLGRGILTAQRGVNLLTPAI